MSLTELDRTAGRRRGDRIAPRSETDPRRSRFETLFPASVSSRDRSLVLQGKDRPMGGLDLPPEGSGTRSIRFPSMEGSDRVQATPGDPTRVPVPSPPPGCPVSHPFAAPLEPREPLDLATCVDVPEGRSLVPRLRPGTTRDRSVSKPGQPDRKTMDKPSRETETIQRPKRAPRSGEPRGLRRFLGGSPAEDEVVGRWVSRV